MYFRLFLLISGVGISDMSDYNAVVRNQRLTGQQNAIFKLKHLDINNVVTFKQCQALLVHSSVHLAIFLLLLGTFTKKIVKILTFLRMSVFLYAYKN